jgi:propanol-preferring alcohol dehydrogenase
MKTKTRPGDSLAILGAGGGLGHMYIPYSAFDGWTLFSNEDTSHRGIQIAVKKGLKVIAIDRYLTFQFEHFCHI